MVFSLRSVNLRSVKPCAVIGFTRLFRLIVGCRMLGAYSWLTIFCSIQDVMSRHLLSALMHR